MQLLELLKFCAFMVGWTSCVLTGLLLVKVAR